MAGEFRWRVALDAVATVAMIAASSALVWAVMSSATREQPSGSKPPSATRPPRAIPSDPISLEGVRLQGQAGARVGVIEFSDFECPSCARFHEQTYPTLLRTYVGTGRIVFGWRHLPIERIHPSAFKAAEAAECAGVQGRFWPMVDELFKASRRLATDGVDLSADRARVSGQQFRECMSGLVAAKIRDDMAAAAKLSVRSTPSFLIGTITEDRRLKVIRHESGAIPAEAFTRMLDEVLQAANRR